MPPRRSGHPIRLGRRSPARPRPSAPRTPVRPAATDRSPWTPAARSALAAGVAEALDRCLARGYPPTFHPELGTSVEAPDEIETLLDVTEIGLCLDTGHFLAAGGDPVAAATRWAGRINQVHVKDARLDRIAEVVRRDEPADAVWSRGVFCPWARGISTSSGVLDALHATGYRGWIVVEQDSLPGDAATFATAAGAQREHRRILERSGFYETPPSRDTRTCT